MKTPLASRQSFFALAAVCLSALMLGLEISSVPPILSTIEQVMGASFRQLQWVMTAYTIAMTTILMAVGTLADRYGRKRMFMLGITAFGLTSLLCGLTEHASILIGARFFQGLSAAIMLICQIAILSTQFRDGELRARAFACWGIVFGAGLGFGPMIGTIILTYMGWQWVFLINAFIALISLYFCIFGVQESVATSYKPLDKMGILTLSLAVLCLVLFVTQGPVLGFLDPISISILMLSILSFIAFIWGEKKSAHPMIEFSVFRIRNFSAGLVGSMGQNFSFWPFIIYLPIYFHVGLGLNSLETGLALLAYTLPTLFMPPIAERLSLRYHARVVIPSGLSMIGLGFVVMYFGSRTVQPLGLILLGCMFAGIGLGLTNTTSTNTITAAVEPQRAGMASGADTSARMISLALNIAVMGFILVEGIMWSLSQRLRTIPVAELRLIAEKVAMGQMQALDATLALTLPTGLPALNTILQTALINGFNWVMLYGAGSAMLLALSSYLIFSFGTKVKPCVKIQ